MGVVIGFVLLLFLTLILVVPVLSLFGVRIVKEYERGVIFRLGKLRPRVAGPGLRVIIPVIDQMKKVNLRTITMPVQSQKIITRDNVSMDVAAVAYFHIVDAQRATVAVEDVFSAIYQIAQTTVRNIVGQSDLDQVLSNTEAINVSIRGLLDATTEKWGIVVDIVEIKDVQLPDSMQRAMARQAEAEREKRAKIIAAEGEALSALKLGEAADIIQAHPVALQLRNLQVLAEIAVEKNSTIIFPSSLTSTLTEIRQFFDQEAKH